MKRLLLLAIVSGLLPGTAVHATQVQFAAPYTGERVTSYAIELRVGRDQTETFQVPGDCATAVARADGGALQWGSMVERRLWAKVIDDCTYSDMVHRNHVGPVEDHISRFDFMNAQIGDLPIGMRCSVPCVACRVVPHGEPRLAELLAQEGDVGSARKAAEQECRISDGVFRGRIIARDGELLCEYDTADPGFRIIAVNFTDVDADGYLDALLRMVPLGPGRGRAPFVLAVTRKGQDEPLSLVPIAR